MATGESYVARLSRHQYHFQSSPSDQVFDFDESDIWNTQNGGEGASHKKQVSSSRDTKSSSLPMNIPDWSKILEGDCRGKMHDDGEDDIHEVTAEDQEEGGVWFPPHEFLARKRRQGRTSSFSVHEGIGRTLKGRDLRRVRNAVWEQTGFED